MKPSFKGKEPEILQHRKFIALENTLSILLQKNFELSDSNRWKRQVLKIYQLLTGNTEKRRPIDFKIPKILETMLFKTKEPRLEC